MYFTVHLEHRFSIQPAGNPPCRSTTVYRPAVISIQNKNLICTNLEESVPKLFSVYL
ncbi:hypothetical protein Hanom_Chr06g00487201 [Helianthus anomalus]